MNRTREYICFAVCFAGLGYIVLWPVTANEAGASFGGSMFCVDAAPDWLGFLCQSAQPLRLAPGLHVLGFMSAVFVAISAVAGSVKRSRRRALPASAALQLADAPVCKPRRPLSKVKPRTNFGLRGVPR